MVDVISDLKTDKALQEEYLSIEVTTYCDGSCNYCFSLPGKESKHLSIETAHNIISEGRDLGYRYLHLTGGEPFLWPHLEKIFQIAVGMGYERILINTGARVKHDVLLALTEEYSDVIRFTITVNGPEVIHELTRGGGSYNQIFNIIKFLDERKIRYEIFTVVTKQLLSKLPEFSQSISENYSNIAWHTWIQMHRVPDDAHDLSEMLLSPEDFISMVKYVSTLSKFGLRIRILDNPLAKVVASRLGLSIPISNPLKRFGRVSILVDETVTSAHSLRNTFMQYTKGSLGKLLQSEQYRESFSQDRNTCDECMFSIYCRENSMLQPSEESRSYEQSAPFCIRVNSLLNEHP